MPDPRPPARPTAPGSVAPESEDDPVEAELDRLRQESVRRQEELRVIAARLPAALSRRTVLRQMVADVVHAPDRGRVARRVVLKVLRTPVDLGRAAAARLDGR